MTMDVSNKVYVYIDLDTEDWTGWRWHVYPDGGEWDNTAFETKEDAANNAISQYPNAIVIDCDDLDDDGKLEANVENDAGC